MPTEAYLFSGDKIKFLPSGTWVILAIKATLKAVFLLKKSQQYEALAL